MSHFKYRAYANMKRIKETRLVRLVSWKRQNRRKQHRVVSENSSSLKRLLVYLLTIYIIYRVLLKRQKKSNTKIFF